MKKYVCSCRYPDTESPEEEVDTKLEYVLGSEMADLVRLVKADTTMGVCRVCLSALNTAYTSVSSVSDSLERLSDENF